MTSRSHPAPGGGTPSAESNWAAKTLHRLMRGSLVHGGQRNVDAQRGEEPMAAPVAAVEKDAADDGRDDGGTGTPAQ